MLGRWKAGMLAAGADDSLLFDHSQRKRTQVPGLEPTEQTASVESPLAVAAP